jgi:hypothetical protein
VHQKVINWACVTWTVVTWTVVTWTVVAWTVVTWTVVTWTVVTWTVVIRKFVAQTVIICTVTIRTVDPNLLKLTEKTDAEIFKLGWDCKNCESRILKRKVLVWFNWKGEFNKQVSSVDIQNPFKYSRSRLMWSRIMLSEWPGPKSLYINVWLLYSML